MARSDIAEKIATMLQDFPSEWDEAHVVYFFVELRKLLDYERASTSQDLPHLRFYCDWIVHISKDRVDEVTLGVVKSMEEGITRQIHSPFMNLGPEAVDFAYFRSLNQEVIKILTQEGINSGLLGNDDFWVEIIATLVKVLEGQPLNIKASHGLNIKSVVFQPSAPRCVIMRVDFNNPVTGRDGISYPFYTLKNAY